MSLSFIVITVPINVANLATTIQEDIIKQELAKKQTNIEGYEIDKSSIQVISTNNGLYATMLAFRKQ